MPTNRNRDTSTLSTLTVAWLVTLAFPIPATAARGPVPVSPGASDRSGAVEARCPTFQWSGVPGAKGYELAVFRLADDGSEPTLVTRASVPGDARGFTPAATDCLERGARYAWSVAPATSGTQIEWSTPYLFEIEAAPSLDELEQAMATIERYRAHHSGAVGGNAGREDAGRQDAGRVDAVRDPEELAAGAVTMARSRSPRSVAPRDAVLPGALTSPTAGITRVASAASTPTLGTPSLRVDANLALGPASNLFKNDYVFLWDDAFGNTALGREALSSVAGTAVRNTAVGAGALENTVGGSVFQGSYNTAIGTLALHTNSTGFSNTASGDKALYSNTTGALNVANGYGVLRFNTFGNNNTASGWLAMSSNTSGGNNTASGFLALDVNQTGGYNTAIGYNALGATTGSRNTGVGTNAGVTATTGSDNIFLGSGATGLAADTKTIRIGGTVVGTGTSQQNRTFINGIRGVTTAINDAAPVLIDSAGQLGTVSSSRALKQDIADLGPLADRLLDLRPVAFRYRQHAAADPETPLQFGLIAEEVAEVFPELVIYDRNGRPETVKYHLLSALLLGELQKQHGELSAVHRELRELRARLDAAEPRDHPTTKQEGARRSGAR